MTFTLFITSIFSVVILTANEVLKYLEGRPQITVFFKSDFPEAKVKELGGKIEKLPDVASVNFVSQEDAFKFYLGQHQSEQSLLESVSREIFPPALEIKTNKISQLGPIAQSLNQEEGLDEIVFFKEVIETFRSWIEGIRFVGVSLISVLAAITLFIILITVGMAIRSRSDEIEIMKLLGATANYIRLPFLTQGLLYGLVSSLVSTASLLIIFPLAESRLEIFLKGLSLPPILNFVLLVSGGQIFVGAFFGVFGAWLSTKRYLRL